MKKSLSALPVVFICFLAFVVFGLSSHIAYALTTTTTVFGWNVFNGTNFVNGFYPLFLPLLFGGIFSSIMGLMHKKGDFFVTLWLLGIALGSLFGTMAKVIPIAMTAICFVILILWLWAGGQGSGSSASGDSISVPHGGFD